MKKKMIDYFNVKNALDFMAEIKVPVKDGEKAFFEGRAYVFQDGGWFLDLKKEDKLNDTPD